VSPLLERDGELATLRACTADAAARRGSVALIAGESGIGKSTLVDAWCADPGSGARVLQGWCDDFLTKRTLGPLHDVARRAGGALADAVAGSDTGAVLDALLAELDDPLRPTVLVLEDVHWADEATLDVLRYVGRRIERLPAVLVATYRDDDLGPDHPLHGVLGALHGPVHRIALRPLSTAAVATLTAGRALDAQEVLQITGGNPFFVTEIAAGEETLPASIADAVTSRVRSLSPAGRAAVELLSVVPGGADRTLQERLHLDVDALAQAEARGILVADERVVRFRHELARLAVRSALPASTRIAHHRTVLDQLVDGDDEAAILHHALEAGRGDVVAEHGPLASHRAFRAGAHREAVAHQANVLSYAHLLEPAERASLLQEHAWTLYNLHRFDEAVVVAHQAVACREELGDPVALARALIVTSRMHFIANEPAAAVDAVERAVTLLDEHGDDEQRAEGRVARAVTHALIEERPEFARQLTEEAVTLTADLEDRLDLRSLALNYRAISECAAGGQPDLADLHEAIRLALEGGHLELAARAYTNLSFELMLSREPSQRVLPALDEALAFLEDHDFPAHAFDVRARQATVRFALGHWAEAERELRALRATTDQHGLIDLVALESLTRIALRRGDADAGPLIASAWGLALRSGATPYVGLIGVIRLEQAWLESDPEQARERLAELPLARLRPRLRAEALRYAQLAGVPVELPTDLPEPWASGLRGDWRAAAAGWRADGRPYELAVELLASGEVDAGLEALRGFDELGAAPAARLARQRLRYLGVRTIPRGPQPATRQHPAGLTGRQAEVLDLLAEGLTNGDIADRLVLSVRTVDHHVAAILQKLGVASRHEAAERVGTLDLGWR
jgi:DNA-binding CsgD family transcriptional regulator/tetratricopeptide (TPR) repeat protein